MGRASSIKLSLILATFLAVLPGWAQDSGEWILSGRVLDAATGEALPGASLQIQGTYSGTISNSEGAFRLSLEEDSTILIVGFIGYATAEVAVGRGEAELDISLEQASLTLPEVIITGEDPAVRIMRQVIAEKQRWRAKLDTYVVNAYNRFRMENDTGIVSIWESGTRAFWDRERGMREVSLWQEQTDNVAVDAFLPAALFVANLYDDDLEIAGHNLMGVTHPDALSKYQFRLESVESSTGSPDVFVLSVEPKGGTFSGFYGTLRIEDQVFAMLSAELTPSTGFLFPPPIQELKANYRQQFAAFDEGTWLPVDLQTQMEIKVGINRVLTFPVFRIRQLSRLTDFQVNVTLPDSLYESDEIVVVDSSVVRPTSRPADVVAVPLSAEEMAAYATIDSTMTMEKAFEPSGVLARMARTEARISSDTTGAVGRVISAGGMVELEIRPDLWYNRVEGFRLGIRGVATVIGSLKATGMAGRGTASSQFSYGYGAVLGRKDKLFVRYRDETVSSFDSAIRGRFFNSGDVTLGRDDYFDYHQEQGWEAGIQFRVPGPSRVDAQVSWSRLMYTSLAQSIASSWLGISLHDTLNPTVDEGRLERVTVELDRSWSFVRFPIGPQQRATLRLEKGIGGTIAGATDYLRGEVDVFLRIPTFHKRRLIPNALDARLVVGRIWGEAPIQRLGIVDGASTLTTFGALKTNDHPPYTGDRWALIAWEHTFRTVPFERLGWDWAVRRHWNVILTAGHGRSQSDHALGAGRAQTGASWHHEAGVSLSGLFTAFRVDASWRLDAPGFRIGIATARIF